MYRLGLSPKWQITVKHFGRVLCSALSHVKGYGLTFKGLNMTKENFVQHIADTLTNGFDENDLNVDDQPMTAFDYLGDALDIEYIVKDRKSVV